MLFGVSPPPLTRTAGFVLRSAASVPHRQSAGGGAGGPRQRLVCADTSRLALPAGPQPHRPGGAPFSCVLGRVTVEGKRMHGFVRLISHKALLKSTAVHSLRTWSAHMLRCSEAILSTDAIARWSRDVPDSDRDRRMQALYQLQRGPMLGEMAGHPDERALLQTTFLASAGLVALRMLLPQLFVFNSSTGGFEATPAVDLALATGGHCCATSPSGGHRLMKESRCDAR